MTQASGPAPVEGVSLMAKVHARRGSFALDVELDVLPGRTLAVLGPNGAGKSTLLETIVGRLRPEHGRVRVGERVVSEPGRGIHVAPEHRRVGLLNQAPSLFPHLSALENVAFGPRAAGVSRNEARDEAARLLTAVGLRGHEERRPARLSGGQQQRVALARALAARPDVLLLDEPFSALDVATAADIRMLTAETLRSTATTAVIVTHDVIDALSLAEDCVVLDAGRVVDAGPLERVLGMPRSPFVAAMAGMNLLAGTSAGSGLLTTDDGRMLRGRESQPLRRGARAFAAFAPASVHIARLEHAGVQEDTSEESSVRGTVERWELGTGGVRVRLTSGWAADVPPAEFASLHLARGDQLLLRVPSSAVILYPADTRGEVEP
ncbi:sulfate/molybdate ABC transporter ATP-binding protein [Rathayibacter sp. KR2-224]|uniref:sulfate/molybdate ABC transporter ATP-binding protein n=1 Tax=Rathayibacter sp. KR2-224 TaxID=3400913 RepID=UPI003C01750A